MVSFAKYDSYKNSGVDWLGDIPEGWEVKKLKFLAKIRLSNVDKHTKSNEIPVKLCNYTDVYYQNFITDKINFMLATATKEQVKNFSLEAGDVLITKDSETSNDIAVPAYVPETLDNVICGYHLAHIKPFFIQGKYLFYAFQTSRIASQFHIASNGITRYGLGKNDINSSVFCVPPLPEQIQIAEYLDKKTSEIDQAISKKYRLIELLEEQKTIIINQAVTKGLNPNTPMKDSGIEWLGSIPEGWEVRRLKSYAMVKRGASPRPIINPRYFDDNGEYGWVRIEDVTKSNKYLLETKQYLSETGVKYSVKQNEGDLFLSIAGSVGKPIISKIKCCIHDGFVWFKWFDLINKDFLFYIFLSGLPFVGLGKQGTQLNLNTTMIGNIKIPAPPLPEQIQIAEYLDTKTAEIEYLKEKTQQQIKQLTEFKQILIANAVTGKIKIM